MTDFFALLNESRRPSLDADSLKAKFLARAAEMHPDRVHHCGEKERRMANENYADLTSAFRCLAEPKDRLLHLLMLETGSKPKVIQEVPADMMSLFMEVGQMCGTVDAVIERKSKATSPLLRAQLYAEGLQWMDQLKTLQQKLAARQNELISELKAMNPLWEQVPQSGGTGRQTLLPLARLETLHRLFSFLHRWSEQVGERLVKIAL
jgi:DnaJ-domain-containing protein 1